MDLLNCHGVSHGINSRHLVSWEYVMPDRTNRNRPDRDQPEKQDSPPKWPSESQRTTAAHPGNEGPHPIPIALPDHPILHYVLREKLGEGGMGIVWQATDTRLGRDVAIKFLPPHYVRDRRRLSRFQREARLLAKINHPNIGAVYS